MNSWKRKLPALAAVLLLSVPSAVGVFRALEPTRGALAAGAAAAGFELTYLSVALLILSGELRQYGRRVALAAVGVAILLNALADYAARVPGGLESGPLAAARFDWLALALSVVESAPLAGLAFALATLLHRLAEPSADQVEPEADRPEREHGLLHLNGTGPLQLARVAEPAQPTYAAPVASINAEPESIGAHQCERCGAELSRAQWLAARRWGHCGTCKEIK